MEEIKRSGLTLDQAKTLADMAMADVKNGFVSTGYYLKAIRDEKLWKDQGYISFDAFLNVNYEKDKSWASRCVSLYEKFGIEVSPGELPKLDPEYINYNVSQLIEMISLPEEKRELVTPETPVRAIREMKPKREKKVETVATSKPVVEQESEDILPDWEDKTGADYPGFYNPDDDKNVDESYSLAGVPRASDRHVRMFARLFVQEKANRLIYGGEAIGITDEEIIKMLKFSYGYGSNRPVIIDIEVSVGAEIIEFSRGDEDLGICLFQKFANFVRKQIDVYVADQLAEEGQKVPQEQQSVKHHEGNTFNSTPTSCHYREGYSCTVLAENRAVPGDGYNCGTSCCWSCKFQGACKLECNASAGRDGVLPEYDASWFVRKWAEEVPEELERVLKACRESSNNTDRAKAVQKEISPYGAHSRSCWEYDFSFHGFAGGMDFRIGKVDIHLKYGRFVQELMNLYPDFVEPESKELETVIEEPENVPEQVGGVPESPENVIDGEYVEVSSEPKPVEPEQPELPILRNNDQRAAFVDSYETWPLWIETKETGERYHRYGLSDGTSIVVKVYHAMLFDYKAIGKKYEDRYSEGYGKHEYYFLQEGKFFKDCEVNRSYLVEKLKEFQKKK